MKKISVGAFPLINIDGRDRKQIEHYLINSLSDLITLNQISQSISDDRETFITPLSILKFTKEAPQGHNQLNQNPVLYRKSQVIRRAFDNTKKLYRALNNDPFYKQHYFYPIYIEEAIKNSNIHADQYVDYKYDFLVVSNDLIQKQLLDEVTFDDSTTLLFLILKTQLYPYLRLDEIGLSGNNVGANFRRNFAVFLESCKNNNVNPIEMFVRVIKMVAKIKSSPTGNHILKNDPRMGVTTTLRATSGATDVLGNFNPREFSTLFNNEGELVDAERLLSFTQRQIGDFLQETRGAIDNDSTFNRQYTQAKVHEYGAILSVIDSLSNFNRANDTVTEINTNDMIQKIERTTPSGERQELFINLDKILSELESTYFPNLVTAIDKGDEYCTKRIFHLTNLRPLYVNPAHSTGQRMTPAQIYQLYQSNQAEIESMSTRVEQLRNRRYTDEEDLENGRRDIDALLAQLRRLEHENEGHRRNYLAAYQSEQQMVNTMKDEASVKAAYKIGLEKLQNHLTLIYAEVYSYFYSNEFKDDLVRYPDLTFQDFKNLSIFKGKLGVEIASLNSTVFELYHEIFSQGIMTGELGKEEENDLPSSLDKASFIDKLNINVDLFKSLYPNSKAPRAIDNQVRQAIKESVFETETFSKRFFTEIISPVFRKNGNVKYSEANRIRDLRIQKNPVLKRMFSNNNLFKAFIFTKELMLVAYDTIHYLDTLKYTSGLIRYPVSKVFNEQNKIQFMINRLGLQDYPVFVLDNSHVTLSLPGHLSMTNTRMFNSVTHSEFTRITNINYDELWKSDNMFGGKTEQSENYKNEKEIRNKLEKITREIRNRDNQIKNAKNQKVRNKLLNQNTQARKEQETLRKQQDSQHRNRQHVSNFANLSMAQRRPYSENVHGSNQNRQDYPNQNRQGYPNQNQPRSLQNYGQENRENYGQQKDYNTLNRNNFDDNSTNRVRRAFQSMNDR